MAFKSRRRTTRKSTGSKFRKRARAPRRRVAARSPRKASSQTIRIVIEQPSPQAQVLPGTLPDQVGRVVATTPRRARF